MSGTDSKVVGEIGANTKLWCPEKDMTASAATVLNNKVVLLYFSAQWCGPCRRFTPLLRDLYRKLKARPSVEDFEVVYCSMDKFTCQYEAYAKEMPWWCLPYRCPAMGKLSNLYECQGIPHLVVLDKDGTVLVRDGVGDVSIDQDGINFPWRPKPLVDLLPSYYLGSDKQCHQMSELDNKYLMLYFSAHWCPPCTRFTPILNNAYLELKQQRNDFELLFISSDHDPAAFAGYFHEMAFAAIAFEEREAKAAISDRLHIRGIPTLVMYGPRPAYGDRPLINDNIRPYFEQKSSNNKKEYLTEFPFHPRPYCDLNKTTVNINNCRCVVIFHEGGDDEEQQQVLEALVLASKMYRGTDGLRFYWGLSSTCLTRTMRDACRLGPIGPVPVMILLDVPDGGAFYVCSSATDIVSPEAVLDFVRAPGEQRHL